MQNSEVVDSAVAKKLTTSSLGGAQPEIGCSKPPFSSDGVKGV